MHEVLQQARCRPGSTCSSDDGGRGLRAPVRRRRVRRGELGDASARRSSRRSSATWRRSPSRSGWAAIIYDVKDVVARRLRDRQRRAAVVQRARGGPHPGAGERHRALHEAGQRRRAQPGRRATTGSRRSSSTTATAPRVAARAAGARRPRGSAGPSIGGTGYVVAEVSPYERRPGLERVTEPDELAPCSSTLGRATAKVHCVADEDSGDTPSSTSRPRRRGRRRRRPDGRLRQGPGRVRALLRGPGAGRPPPLRRRRSAPDEIPGVSATTTS